MATSEPNIANPDDSRRKIIIIVAIVSALLIAGLFYVLMRASGGGSNAPVRLVGAIRAGSPEFARYAPLIVCDNVEADESKRALGDIVMMLHGTVRNFTGKTINGLEVRGVVVDHQDKPVKESTVVVIPVRRAELEPNKTMLVEVTVTGMSPTADRANIRLEVVGFRFK